MATIVKGAQGTFRGSALSIMELRNAYDVMSFSRELESIAQILGPALQVS